jgi:hypothetical protein
LIHQSGKARPKNNQTIMLMKTLIKPLLVAFSLSLISLSASIAEGTPTRPAAAYKTGIYRTTEGKLRIALDKEPGGRVDIKLKSADGKILFVQHLGKKQQTSRMLLDLNNLPDGTYQVEITNGVETTTQTVTLATQQPSVPSRLIALN